MISISWIWAVVLYLAAAQEPSILFDGRLPSGTTPEDFDRGTTPYDADKDRPHTQKWADLITLDGLPKSMFDGADDLSFKVSVTSENVADVIPGFSRAALTPAYIADYSDAVVTYHVSMLHGPSQSLNALHPYFLVYLEGDTESLKLFSIRYGNDLTPGGVVQEGATRLRVMTTVKPESDRGPSLAQQLVFDTGVDFTADVYQNFAITIDYKASTIAVYHSLGDSELVEVVAAQPCVVAPSPTLHVGILQVPIPGADDSDAAAASDNGRAVIYGGIFVEDSSDGVVTTKI